MAVTRLAGKARPWHPSESRKCRRDVSSGEEALQPEAIPRRLAFAGVRGKAYGQEAPADRADRRLAGALAAFLVARAGRVRADAPARAFRQPCRRTRRGDW